MYIKRYREVETQLTTEVLIKRISSLLENQDYIREKTKNRVSFKNEFFRFRPNGAILKRMDKGQFEIVNLAAGSSKIEFTY